VSSTDKYTDPITKAKRNTDYWQGVAMGLLVALILCLVAWVRVV